MLQQIGVVQEAIGGFRGIAGVAMWHTSLPTVSDRAGVSTSPILRMAGDSGVSSGRTGARQPAEPNASRLAASHIRTTPATL